MNKTVIECNGIAAGYVKGLNILQGVDLIVDEKEIVSIIGPNGAGKSTLLKAIMGIINISGGRFFINGVEKTNTPTHQIVSEGVGYVPQVENVFPSLTIAENLEIGSWSVKDNINMAIMDKNSEYLILDKLKDLQNASELQEKLNIKVSYWSQLAQSLSGGNQQKTVIAKWLSTKPEIIILDEPTKGIDVRSKSAVHEFMGELVDSGMSIIMISSELPEILGMCDRVVVMYKGLIKNILDVSKTSSEEIVGLASGE